MSDPVYGQATHRAPKARSSLFCGTILDALPSRDGELRILDIGCGTGDHVFALARDLPRARITGVDISEANIASARQTCRERSLEDRVSFFCGDYLEFPRQESFGLIVSDTTLHLIPRSDAELFGRIAADLAPGGRLVMSLPYACLYNQLLWSVRRLLRLVRGRLSDALILGLAKLVFGKRYSEAMLRERLIYMYILPERFDCPTFRKMLETEHHLVVVTEIAEPFVAGKANHRILVLARVSD